MKIVHFKCDTCEQSFTNDTKLLRIGSEDEAGLSIKNNLPNPALIEMNNCDAHHFCSKECFVSYFFKADTSHD